MNFPSWTAPELTQADQNTVKSYLQTGQAIRFLRVMP